MNFQSGITTKNFASQSGLSCSFLFDKNFDRKSKIIFGVSGDESHLMSLSNGIFYDQNNRSFSSLNYQSDELINLNISNSKAIIYSNEKILSSLECSGLFNNLYISGDRSFDINISLKGEPFNISFSQLTNFSGDNRTISGLIINETANRPFRITGVTMLENQEFVTISQYETGDLLTSGLIVFSGVSGLEFASGIIDFEVLTNYKTLPFSLNSNPFTEINEEEYLNLIPNEFFLNNFESKDLSIESYFNYGPSRDLSVTLSHVSNGIYVPLLTNFDFAGTGILTGFISGAGLISGQITGLFSGVYTGISGYTSLYEITGEYSGSSTVLSSGFSTTGISSGTLFTGNLPFNYSGVLVSGNSGSYTGQVTGISTGYFYTFSGLKNQNFTFETSGVGPFGYLGYSGSGINTQQGFRSEITGLNFVLSISGGTPGDEDVAGFEITDWVHQGTGAPITGYKSSNYESFEIDSTHFSGFSGADMIYTGILPNPATFDSLSDLIDNNVSGTISLFLGQTYFHYYPTPWALNYFYISNMPVNIYNSVDFAATGIYDYKITGNIEEQVTGILTTGILYSSGQPNFTDIWNMKTGTNSLTFYDFKYFNKFSSGHYENSGSFAKIYKDNLNSTFLNISHNGLGVSGLNVAELNITDGINTLNYTITGYGE